MDKKAYILSNIPASYYGLANAAHSRGLITDFIESTLDIDVKDVKLHPFTPGKALVLVDGIIGDFDAARKALQKCLLDSQILELRRAHKETAVIVENFDEQRLSKDDLDFYFNSEFAGGKDVIESSWLQPHLQMAVIKFPPSEKKVVQKILKKKDHVLLPSENYQISVSPFYRNFHEYTQHQQGLGYADEGVQDVRDTLKPKGSSSSAKYDLAHRDRKANLTREMDTNASWSKRRNESSKKSSENNVKDTCEKMERERTEKHEKKIRVKKTTKDDINQEEKEQGKMDGKKELEETARDLVNEVEVERHRGEKNKNFSRSKNNDQGKINTENLETHKMENESEDEGQDEEDTGNHLGSNTMSRNSVLTEDVQVDEEKEECNNRSHEEGETEEKENSDGEGPKEDEGEIEESDTSDQKEDSEEEGSEEEAESKISELDAMESGTRDKKEEANDDNSEGESEEWDTAEEKENSEEESSEEEVWYESYEFTETLKSSKRTHKYDKICEDKGRQSESSDSEEDEEGEVKRVGEEERLRLRHQISATDHIRGSHRGRGSGNKFSAKSGKNTIRETPSNTGEYSLSKVQKEAQESPLKKTHLQVLSETPKKHKPTMENFRARGPQHSTRKDPERCERDKCNTRQISSSEEECKTRTREVRSSLASAEDILWHPGMREPDCDQTDTYFKNKGGSIQGSSNIKSRERPKHEFRGRGGSKYVPASSGRQDVSSRIGKLLDRKGDSYSRVHEDPEFVKGLEDYKRAQEENARPKEKTTEKLDLEPFRVALLQHCFGQFGECSVTYDHKEKCIVLIGPDDSVKKQQIEVLKEIKVIKEKGFELCPDMIALFKSDAGKRYIENLNICDLNGAKAFFDGKSLTVIANEENILKAAEDKLKQRLNHTIILSSECEIPLDKLKTLQDHLEPKLLIKMSWNDKCTSIFVKGIRDDIIKCEAEIQGLIKECEVWEETFTVDGPRAQYFNKFYRDKVNLAVRGAEIIHSDITDQRVIIKFKGTKTQIAQVSTDLKKLRDQVNLERWTLKSEFQGQVESALIAHALESTDIQSKIQLTEYTKRCCVIIEASQGATSEPSDTRRATEQWTHHKKWSRKTLKKKRPDELKLKVTENCQLIIKSFGDITKERSEILVCTLTQNADLRKTRVGQAFNKACSSLWKKLKYEYNAHPSESVLTTKGPFRGLMCQAICHVILTPWNPDTSPAQLDNAIQTVLGQAKALDITSISFPPLGCGRAFKFPPESVAQIVLSNINQSNISSSMTKIVLLACNRDLYRELKEEAQKRFQADVAKTEGAVGGAAVELSANSDKSEEGIDEGEQRVEDMQPCDLPISDDLDIIIVSEEDPPAIWPELKGKILDHCLHEFTYSQETLQFWPIDSQVSIFQEAKEQFIWVEKHEDAKSNQLGFKLKGEKNAVNKMKDYITQEFKKLTRNKPKQSIKSKQAPRRGTVEFLKFASGKDEMYPSYWKLTKEIKKMNKKDMQNDEPGKNVKEEEFLVKVDSKTKRAIEKLVKSTWDPSLVGRGLDAGGLKFTGIEIMNVQRIENPYLFATYQAHRRELFRKMAKKDQICQDVGTLPSSKGRINTTENLEDFMKEELYCEINEHYLFHGTRKSLIPVLSRNGLDPKVSSLDSMFGRGIYAAEDFTKSDQYADDRQARTPLGTELTVILSRMLLGNVFVCDHTHPSVASRDAKKLRRPPCMSCKQDVCQCHGQQLYDSVMGDGKWIFREFVVYDGSYCYPEYVITYKRF